MSTHAKDLRRPPLDTSGQIVFVVDQLSFPTLRSVFINGVEVPVPVDGDIQLEYTGSDLTIAHIPVIVTQFETITSSEMESRVIKE